MRNETKTQIKLEENFDMKSNDADEKAILNFEIIELIKFNLIENFCEMASSLLYEFKVIYEALYRISSILIMIRSLQKIL